jgi:thiol-disulfide isomerase/thioredoxin
MNHTIKSKDEFDKIVRDELAVLFYFSTPTCNVCQALKPKINDAFEKNFPKIKRYFIDSLATPDIPATLGIFSVPTILVYFDSKEFVRESRNLSVDAFIQKTKRAYDLIFEQ